MTRNSVPPRVERMDDYWSSAPPEPSRKLIYWINRFASTAWRPNKRIRTRDYWDAAHFFGVYLWEYSKVIFPVLYPNDGAVVASHRNEIPRAPTPAWEPILAKAKLARSFHERWRAMGFEEPGPTGVSLEALDEALSQIPTPMCSLAEIPIGLAFEIDVPVAKGTEVVGSVKIPLSRSRRRSTPTKT